MPKLQKNNIPLRPIVSSIQSPTYYLYKVLGKGISGLIGTSQYYIKDYWPLKICKNDCIMYQIIIF